MKVAKRILTLTMILVMIISILLYFNSKSTISSITTRRPVKVGVLLYKGNAFSSLVAKSLEDIQNENKDKVEFTFFDGKANAAVESETLNNILQNNYDLILANIVDTQAQELTSVSANWDEKLAKNAIESLLLKYDGSIEVIIANNDAMAIGAIKALQKYGYNIGDKEKTIPVFEINETSEAKDLIKKGFMAGSVPESPRSIAEALYTVGMNLVSGGDPIEGTNYKFDKSGVIIPIQSQENISQNGNQ